MDNSKMSEYWTKSSEGYTKTIMYELKNEPKAVWLELINKNRPAGDCLKILDAGCGPGFFSILMAQEGHEVTAIDFSDGMLEQARQNTAACGVRDKVSFYKMDAQCPDFPDESFDLILSRNITWIFPEPESAYRNWLRLLKPGGKFILFDGNWHLYMFDAEQKRLYDENLKRAVELGYDPERKNSVYDVETREMVRNLPLSNQFRPDWDIVALDKIGGCKVTVDRCLPRNVMEEKYAVKNEHTPMFMVCAEKLK